MLRNQFISHARKSKHELVFDDNKLPDLPDVTEMNDQDFYAELYKAIQKIPEQRRKILELAVFESQSYKEIAVRLGISVNTVKTQMGRSYQFLKEELDPKNFSLLYFFMKKKKQIQV
jgi:RNA polymerase sigma-70 factor (ECF subfamily)